MEVLSNVHQGLVGEASQSSGEEEIMAMPSLVEEARSYLHKETTELNGASTSSFNLKLQPH